MNGELRRVTNGGRFQCLLIKFENGKWGRTYTGEDFRNFDLWRDFKVGDHITGLKWKDEKKGILDADSPVALI